MTCICPISGVHCDVAQLPHMHRHGTKVWFQQVMATEQLTCSDSLIIPVGISTQIVIQELYDSCTWTVSDCGSYSKFYVLLSQLS